MRKQYHFRPGSNGLQAWDVDRLVAMAADLPTEAIPLHAVVEVDSPYWFDHGTEATVRQVVDHMRLVDDADLQFPIIVDPDGRVMDGMHRVAKALLLGLRTIDAKRLPVLPAPDHTGVRPEDLSYDEQPPV